VAPAPFKGATILITAELDADFLELVPWPQSPRSLDAQQVDHRQAPADIRQLDGLALRAGGAACFTTTATSGVGAAVLLTHVLLLCRRLIYNTRKV
jgi:hypothetical protein